MIIFKFLKINDNYIDFCTSIISTYLSYSFKLIEVFSNFYFFYLYSFSKTIVKKNITFNKSRRCVIIEC